MCIRDSLCLTYQKEYLIIGNGSNLLVSDKGISGVVIEIGKQMDEITVDGTTIYAQAGAMLSKTAHAALEAGLTGMEFAAGIPGCVGGAVVMNAGAYGGEMKDILKSVTVLTADGQEKELTPGELDMSYRHSSITEEMCIRDRIIVDKPDLKGREAILQVHAKDVLMDETVDLNAIALATSGAVSYTHLDVYKRQG